MLIELLDISTHQGDVLPLENTTITSGLSTLFAYEWAGVVSSLDVLSAACDDLSNVATGYDRWSAMGLHIDYMNCELSALT